MRAPTRAGCCAIAAPGSPRAPWPCSSCVRAWPCASPTPASPATVARGAGRSEEPGSRVTGREAVLSHVAVIPGGRGAGIGTALVDAFLDRLRERSVEQALLVTASGLSGAGAFYRRHGWQFEGSSVG